MKILVIDDAFFRDSFAGRVANEMREELNLDATAIMPVHGGGIVELTNSEGTQKKLTDDEVLSLVKEADIIFIDHNMPITGEELLSGWRKVIDFTNKRVVGISAGEQTYLEEHFNWLNSIDAVKSFLGLT